MVRSTEILPVFLGLPSLFLFHKVETLLATLCAAGLSARHTPAPAGSRSSRIGGQSLGLPIFYGRLPSRCLWLGLALGSPNPSTVDSELGSPEDCPGPAPVDSAPAAKAPESGRLGVREPAVASGAPNPWREKRTPKKTMCECTAGRCLILLLHQPNTEASGEKIAKMMEQPG